MTQLAQQIKERNLTLEIVQKYEYQWPEQREKIYDMMRQLINVDKVPILHIARELQVDRGKVYRMYYGWDVDALPQRWTEREDKEVRRLYKKMQYAEIAKILGRSKDSVCNRVKTLGLRKKPIKRQPQADQAHPF